MEKHIVDLVVGNDMKLKNIPLFKSETPASSAAGSRTVTPGQALRSTKDAPMTGTKKSEGL